MTLWLSTSAANERADSSPASSAARRGTPAPGSRTRSAATVSELAAAGSSRTLKFEISTFWTSHKSSG